MEDTKKCTRCKNTLDKALFTKVRSNSDGLCIYCKPCRRAIRKEQRPKFAAKLNAKQREYEKRRGYCPERRRKAYLRLLQRATVDLSFAVKMKCRNRLSAAFRGVLKTSTTQELLGCDFVSFQMYMESLWLEGMSWENHGKGPGTWQIDHIIPIASFDLADPDQLQRCFHYTNCQPLWTQDNLHKNASMPSPDIVAAVNEAYDRATATQSQKSLDISFNPVMIGTINTHL